ncbi:MAG: serine/threonine-protein kinase [Polyangiales bacterium]
MDDTTNTSPESRMTPDTGMRPGSSELIEGRYRVERELGRGAMGVVYEATDTGLGRRVALKVISREFAGDPQFVERFEREAKALAAIRHENVVQVHALGEHHGARFYAMEFVQGRTLESALAERASRHEPWPTREAINLIRQLASGLSAVHAARIIHRDVKPANILIERETGRPVLIDFGIARPAFVGSARSTLMVGSPAYMAPEQIQANPGVELSPAADLYALGCVAYELFALRPPFDSEEVYEVLRDQVSTPAERLSVHRPDLAYLDATLARLLAKRPEDRPAGCLALVRELDRILERDAPQRESFASPAPTLTEGDGARVMLVSTDKAFLARARLACSLAFRGAWTEVSPGTAAAPAIDRLREHGPSLAIVHCDGFHDSGAGFIARLREIVGGPVRVLVFGSDVDALDRWRLGGLGLSGLHAASLSGEAMADVISRHWSKERPSGMPGARKSAIITLDGASPRVPVELFLLVISCGWSEGALPPLAATQIIDAARAEGHGPEAMASIERACLSPIELVDVDATLIPAPVRSYAYAFATWIALIDNVISTLEESTLHVLAYVLGLSSRERTALQSAVEQACERGVLSPRAGFRYADYQRSFGPRMRQDARASIVSPSIAPPQSERA